jgi:hypothetical protein
MNALKAAFPESNRMQGYTHIVRKFISPWNRKGNGSYITQSRTKNSKWVYKEARQDINRLHHCKTKEQFECYADLMEQAWASNHELLMFKTFARQYIDNKDFNRWWYATSGLPGHVPCYNPHESHNYQLKAGFDFKGFMQGGRSMTNTIWTEFPNLIYRASEAKCDMGVAEPILDYRLMCRDGVLYSFFQEFDLVTNRRPYKEGFVCVGPAHLHHTVTEEDVKQMEQSLEGIFEKCFERLEELVMRTEMLHVIFEQRIPDGSTVWRCDCYEYYAYKWCRVAAAHQHQNRLERDATRLPDSRRAPRKKSQKEVENELISASMQKKRYHTHHTG